MGAVVYRVREVVCTAFLLKWLRLTLFLSSVHILPHEISVDAVCSFTSSPGWVLTCYETAALLCSGGRCSFRGWSNSCQHPACLINLLGLLQIKVREECCVMWQMTWKRYFLVFQAFLGWGWNVELKIWLLHKSLKESGCLQDCFLEEGWQQGQCESNCGEAVSMWWCYFPRFAVGFSVVCSFFSTGMTFPFHFCSPVSMCALELRSNVSNTWNLVMGFERKPCVWTRGCIFLGKLSFIILSGNWLWKGILAGRIYSST